MKVIVLIISLFMSAENKMFSQSALFIYEYHDDQSKSGRFVFRDPGGDFSFESSASAGFENSSNNPYMQTIKDYGPIPFGKWKISSVKRRDLAIFRLTPDEGVITGGRDGFLIHGSNENGPTESSEGCIILDPNSRKLLLQAFDKYGAITLEVTNRIY